MLPDAIVPAGTRVVYWGQAAGGKYYGRIMVVKWANECGCRHQTYCLEPEEGTGQLSQAMRESFRVIGEE